MSLDLIVFVLSAFVFLSAAISVVMWMAWPLIVRGLAKLPPSEQLRSLWLMSLTPLVVVGFLLVLAILPAYDNSADHCLVHPGAFHLCPHHLLVTPGWLMRAVASLGALTFVFALFSFVRNLITAHRTIGALDVVTESDRYISVFPSTTPQAFVLGFFRARLYLSSALLGLDRRLLTAVVAHEESHIRAFDWQLRLLFPLSAFAHIPPLRRQLFVAFVTAQEMRADAEAARVLGDRSSVAEAIVAMRRVQIDELDAQAVSAFVHGDIRARVNVLMNDDKTMVEWPVFVSLSVCVLLSALFLFSNYHQIHYLMEDFLSFFI